MATVALPNDQRRRLVDLIAERGGVRTALDRFNLLEDAGLRRFEARLNVDASAGDFSRQLVRVLQDHGTLEATGQPALVPLLRELRERVRGHEEDAAFLDDLLAPYQRGVATDAREAPRAGETLPAPAKRPGAPLKLFVSYRRTIWPFAERLVEDLGRHIDADIFIDISGVDEANFETPAPPARERRRAARRLGAHVRRRSHPPARRLGTARDRAGARARQADRPGGR